MLLSMQRVQIIGTKGCQAQTVQQLHHLGIIQINSWSEARAPFQQRMRPDEQALHLRERVAYVATRVDAVLSALPSPQLPSFSEYDDYSKLSADRLLDVIAADLAKVETRAQELTRHCDRLEEQLGALPRYETTLRRLLPLIPSLVDLEHYTVTAIWVERHSQAALQTIIRELEDLTGHRCEVISREVDHDILAAVLIYPKTQAGAVSSLLGQENITQVRLPGEFANRPIDQALSQIRQRLLAIPDELAGIEAEQETLARQWHPRLLAWQALLRDQLAEIEVVTNFGQTNYTFVIEGWVPADRLPELKTFLARNVGNEVIVTELGPRHEEEVEPPVMFANPFFARPFEPLVGLLALPRYGAFDPTPLMAIFLPIFFGLILGDVAYGAILLALMLYLRRRFKSRPTLRSLADVLLFGAAWGIVFGFLFGEFFGTLGEEVGLHPLWFDRGHNVQALFLLTLGIGAGHILLGLGLGVWQALRQHNRHDLMEKVATLIALAGLFLLISVLTDYLPPTFFSPAIALMVVGLAILIYSLGGLGILLGPLEFLGTIGNILSYLRLAAIGLSSVYLAQIGNELAGVAGNVVVGFIIAGLFHALNIALGAFSPTIQALRLHYVEFFGKFYEGGGQPFRPFQRSKLSG